jgi:hypothetical protein
LMEQSPRLVMHRSFVTTAKAKISRRPCRADDLMPRIASSIGPASGLKPAYQHLQAHALDARLQKRGEHCQWRPGLSALCILVRGFSALSGIGATVREVRYLRSLPIAVRLPQGRSAPAQSPNPSCVADTSEARPQQPPASARRAPPIDDRHAQCHRPCQPRRGHGRTAHPC